MRRLALIPVAALCLALLPSAAAAGEMQEWTIDKNHTGAYFKVKHLLIATVRGSFNNVSGTVKLDPDDMTKLEVDATIDATTVDTGNDKRDQHLKSADFFNIKEHPTITFKSKKVEKDDDELKITGDLTLNGVTKEVVLEVEDITEAVLNPAGWLSRAASAKTTLNRQDFKVSWNKSLDGGGVVVGDEVKVEIDIELLRKPEKSAKK